MGFFTASLRLMNSIALRAEFFDASALAKIFTVEPYSTEVQSYWHLSPTKHTTPFCFYEAMNVLKSKWKFKNQLNYEEYLEAAFKLTTWFGASSKSIKDLDFSDPIIFHETKALAARHTLDLSDAFQIMSVKKGYFSGLVNDSATILVTADKQLATSARAEGLRAWDITSEPPPE